MLDRSHHGVITKLPLRIALLKQRSQLRWTYECMLKVLPGFERQDKILYPVEGICCNGCGFSVPVCLLAHSFQKFINPAICFRACYDKAPFDMTFATECLQLIGRKRE